MISPSFSSGISRGVCQGVGLLKPTLAMVWSSSIWTTCALAGKERFRSVTFDRFEHLRVVVVAARDKAANAGALQPRLCQIHPGAQPSRAPACGRVC